MAYNRFMGTYGSPPDDRRVQELEQRVEQLEEMVERLTKMKKPSFMDFDFIKNDEDKEEETRRSTDSQMRRMRQLFSRG
jgi:TolA-binding protein